VQGLQTITEMVKFAYVRELLTIHKLKKRFDEVLAIRMISIEGNANVGSRDGVLKVGAGVWSKTVLCNSSPRRV